jgi:hypothetical protein
MLPTLMVFFPAIMCFFNLAKHAYLEKTSLSSPCNTELAGSILSKTN